MAQDEDQEFSKYVQENLATGEIGEKGTSIPADSLAQIMQEIIKLDPELSNFVGTEIRTGYMDEQTYMIYTRLLMIAYHMLLRGKQFGFPMKTTPKDILFAAKVMASASTSKNAKLLETLVSSKREISVGLPKQQKKGILGGKS